MERRVGLTDDISVRAGTEEQPLVLVLVLVLVCFGLGGQLLSEANQPQRFPFSALERAQAGQTNTTRGRCWARMDAPPTSTLNG